MCSICFKNSTNERREDEKSNKNSSLFSKKRHNHYLILSYKQNKENSLKFWATTTFRRQFDVFVFVENRSFFFFERCLRRLSRISLKIKRRLWIKNRFKNDASLKRNERRDLFFFWVKNSLKKHSFDELLLEARFSSTSFCDDVISSFFLFFFDSTTSFFWSFIDSIFFFSNDSTSTSFLFFLEFASTFFRNAFDSSSSSSSSSSF